MWVEIIPVPSGGGGVGCAIIAVIGIIIVAALAVFVLGVAFGIITLPFDLISDEINDVLRTVEYKNVSPGFRLGSVTDNEYESQTLDMRIQLDSNWRMFNETEIVQLMGYSGYEMYASKGDDSGNYDALMIQVLGCEYSSREINEKNYSKYRVNKLTGDSDGPNDPEYIVKEGIDFLGEQHTGIRELDPGAFNGKNVYMTEVYQFYKSYIVHITALSTEDGRDMQTIGMFEQY